MVTQMTSTEWRAFIRREIVLFIQYFTISLLAFLVGQAALENHFRPMLAPLYQIHPGDDPNLNGMMKIWLRFFIYPWFSTFMGLAAARFLVVLIIFRFSARGVVTRAQVRS